MFDTEKESFVFPVEVRSLCQLMSWLDEVGEPYFLRVKGRVWSFHPAARLMTPGPLASQPLRPWGYGAVVDVDGMTAVRVYKTAKQLGYSVYK